MGRDPADPANIPDAKRLSRQASQRSVLGYAFATDSRHAAACLMGCWLVIVFAPVSTAQSTD